MEEARSVVERLGRIETMRRANAGPAELLAELRCLLHEAERWAVVEGGDAGIGAVGRLRDALDAPNGAALRAPPPPRAATGDGANGVPRAGAALRSTLGGR